MDFTMYSQSVAPFGDVAHAVRQSLLVRPCGPIFIGMTIEKKALLYTDSFYQIGKAVVSAFRSLSGIY
jgi:hypothetical protein